MGTFNPSKGFLPKVDMGMVMNHDTNINPMIAITENSLSCNPPESDIGLRPKDIIERLWFCHKKIKV